MQAILKHVNENLGYSKLSLQDAGYKIRSSNDIIYSAYGTEAEKANLLNGLLNAAGIKAEAAAAYRVKADPASCGLSAISGLLVLANVDGKQYIMSPISNKMAATGWNDATPVISMTNAGTPVAVNSPSTDINYKVSLAVSPEKQMHKSMLQSVMLICLITVLISLFCRRRQRGHRVESPEQYDNIL